MSTRRTVLVCRDCRAKGYHPSDLTTYYCRRCQCDLGAHRFKAAQITNHKYHQKGKLGCKQCITTTEDRLRRLQVQMQRIKRRCNCNSPIHQAKCPLTPVRAGEMRWPGKDGAISKDDYTFVNNLDPLPKWWKSAWGRK